MTTLTFKNFLSMVVNEDTQQDIDKIRADLSTLDATIQQRTKPLLAQKDQLTKMLAIKTKQQQAEQAQTGQPTQQTPTTPQAGGPPQGSAVSTPGSTSGNGTPGSGSAF